MPAPNTGSASTAKPTPAGWLLAIERLDRRPAGQDSAEPAGSAGSAGAPGRPGFGFDVRIGQPGRPAV